MPEPSATTPIFDELLREFSNRAHAREPATEDNHNAHDVDDQNADTSPPSRRH